jgi:hypothetical protein
MALGTDQQLWLQDKVVLPTSLKPSVGFGETVTDSVCNASLSVERLSVNPLISESYSKMPS